MPDFTLHPRPVFRATAADQRHAAIVARHLCEAGKVATPTTVIRAALARAAEAMNLHSSQQASRRD